MKAAYWRAWEKYSPSAKLEIRTGAAIRCLKPNDRILPIEGLEERMYGTEPQWRLWEKHLPPEATNAIVPLSEIISEKPEKVHT